MGSDVIINKVHVIERCLRRINDEYDGKSEHLENFTKQDSIILNPQRAIEASIDLAMHMIAKKKMGLPQTSREAFDLLFENHIISKDLVKKLKAMVGFRNVAVHDYQALNIAILEKILQEHLEDFKEFSKEMLRFVG